MTLPSVLKPHELMCPTETEVNLLDPSEGCVVPVVGRVVVVRSVEVVVGRAVVVVDDVPEPAISISQVPSDCLVAWK